MNSLDWVLAPQRWMAQVMAGLQAVQPALEPRNEAAQATRTTNLLDLLRAPQGLASRAMAAIEAALPAPQQILAYDDELNATARSIGVSDSLPASVYLRRVKPVLIGRRRLAIERERWRRFLAGLMPPPLPVEAPALPPWTEIPSERGPPAAAWTPSTTAERAPPRRCVDSRAIENNQLRRRFFREAERGCSSRDRRALEPAGRGDGHRIHDERGSRAR
jgi:hypothetical protein